LVFSRRAQNAENNLYKLDRKYRRTQKDAAAEKAAGHLQQLKWRTIMQGSKPVMQNRPVAYGAQPGGHFSWNIAAQAAALAAAFLFVSALVCGAI
jgi:hypothetical protein